MKQHRPVSLIIAATLLATIPARQHGGTAQTFRLAGGLLGASGKSVLYVALWQADGFLKRPVQQIRIEPGAERTFRFEVAAGRWAVSAFEDRNDNGILDMGFFGPKEPSGFWRAFSGHRKPRFDDVASVVASDTLDADILLR